MNKLHIKFSNGKWVNKNAIKGILKSYFLNESLPENMETEDVSEAKSVNWFSFGFMDFIFKSYNLIVREAYILKLKPRGK